MTVPMLPATVRPGPPARLFRSVLATVVLSATLFGPVGYLGARLSGRGLDAVPTGIEVGLVVGWVLAAAVVASALLSVRRQPRRVRPIPLIVQSAVRGVVEVSSFGCGTLLRWTATHPETDLGALLVRPSPEHETEIAMEGEAGAEQPVPNGRRLESASASPGASPAVGYDGMTAEYRVERADTWWLLAERSLGDGRRWRTIVELNIGREVEPETFVVADSPLRRGWLVLLPVPDNEERAQ